jgi:biopolymer transport protein ExbB/TolQ
MKGYFLLVSLFLVVNTFTTIWVVYRVSAALEILRTVANVMDEVRHVQESVTALRESLSHIKSIATRNEVSRDAPWNRILAKK